jgi:hypothetical protein
MTSLEGMSSLYNLLYKSFDIQLIYFRFGVPNIKPTMNIPNFPTIPANTTEIKKNWGGRECAVAKELKWY